MGEQTRIDKWLWEVRLFKTRTLASEACRTGKVTINDQPVKASREPKIDDLILIRSGGITRTLKLLAFPKSRVSAKLVPDYMSDLTPEAEYQKLKDAREFNFVYRDRGVGRPTKKERRDINKISEW
jgi:ribosome-associated heat shock protein Hsp15